MNPLTKVKLINELNEREHQLGVKESVSWHTEYKDSAWVFVGGFPYELTEGDVICVFSQYGEIVNINLVRDKKTGKSKGFCFICFEDQRSTILAVDNLNGIKIKGRTIRVDHVSNYKPPKDTEDIDDITKNLRDEGCAPKLPDQLSSEEESEEEEEEEEEQYAVAVKKSKKDKKQKKKKKKEKKKEKKEKKKAVKEEYDGTGARVTHSSSSPPSLSLPPAVTIKQEKQDAGYDSYVHKRAHRDSKAGVAEQRNSRSGDRHGADDGGFHGRHGDQHVGESRHREEEDRRREDEWERDADRPRERARERDREKGAEREGDDVKWHKERERDHNRDGGRERDREGRQMREREDERDGESDRRKERDVKRERERDRDVDRKRDRGTDRERDRSGRRRESSQDREHRRS
ncbi:RNA-binding motif protein, X-linked 2 [Gadus morhua]|uniref:RNA-binding motif protein, X-linked 2 n=1 Tax=Gadus morhua TaxID=8049 RepID=A0A8C5B556_GADMO|nr:RNA-binding motif protein, X-linked 2 [Gadus morhua]